MKLFKSLLFIILYSLFIILNWALSLLPLRFLYILSDLLYFVLYYIVRYRKEVVYNNLYNAFPDKSDKEIELIAKKYYKNLSDIFIEVLKLKHISPKELNRRVNVKNKELIYNYYDNKKKIIATAAHLGNWEWVATVAPDLFRQKVYLVYKPLSNKFFNDYLLKLRSQLGLNFIPFKQTYRYLLKNKEELNMTIVANDQTPARSEIEYWAKFLNQDTGFFIGIEKMSKSLDCAVIFVDIKRYKRGYYEVEFINISDNPKQTKEFEITDKYINLLQNHIMHNPDNWLWSHRRWKHKN